MSDDPFSRRLEDLFSGVRRPTPDPMPGEAQPGRDAADQARLADLEKQLEAARQQAEQDRRQAEAAALELATLQARVSQLTQAEQARLTELEAQASAAKQQAEQEHAAREAAAAELRTLQARVSQLTQADQSRLVDLEAQAATARQQAETERKARETAMAELRALRARLAEVTETEKVRQASQEAQASAVRQQLEQERAGREVAAAEAESLRARLEERSGPVPAQLSQLENALAEAQRRLEAERLEHASTAAEKTELQARVAELETAPPSAPFAPPTAPAPEPEPIFTRPSSRPVSERTFADRPTNIFDLIGGRQRPPEEEERQREARRNRNTAWLSVVTAAAMAIVLVFSLIEDFGNRANPFSASNGLTLLILAGGLLAFGLTRTTRRHLAPYVLLTATSIAAVGTVTLIGSLGIPIAITLGLLAVAVSGLTLHPRRAGLTSMAGTLAAVVVVIVDTFWPYPRWTSGISLAVYVVLGLVSVVMGALIARQFRAYTLRTKIVLGVLLTAGAAILGYAGYNYVRTNQTQQFISDQLFISVKTQAEHQVTSLAAAQAQEAGQPFEDIAGDLTALAEYRTQLYRQAASVAQSGYWDGHTQLLQLAGGQWGNAQSEPGSVFVPSTIAVDEALIADLNLSAQLDFVAPTFLAGHPNVVAVYFISASGATRYYPNIGLAEAVPPDFDPRTQPFFTDGTPQNNPDRQTVWTVPYQDPAGTGLIVSAVAPVFDQQGIFRGVMAADVELAAIAEQIAGITAGSTGYAFLIDPIGRILAMPAAGYQLFGIEPETVPVNETPKLTVLGHGSLDLRDVTRRMVDGETGVATIDVDGTSYFAAFAPVSALRYSLGLIVPVTELIQTFTQTQQELGSSARDTQRLATLLLTALLLVAALVSLAIGQVIATPLVRLTETARQISEGHLTAQARVETEDEAGLLARTFNTMTAQLRAILQGLEQRVAERTRDLSLAAEVGQRVAQMRDLDTMLSDAVELIRARFDLYYAQVYLTNPANTTLVLRAGTGAVGHELLRRSHRLPLGLGSINGAAATEKKPVLVEDTALSTIHRANPLLPATRSEVAVPLLVGERVVGVLDLQAVTAGTFSNENLPAFEALAGQLAVAIDNAALFDTAQQARADLEAQARRLTAGAWQDYLNAIDRSEHLGFAFDQAALTRLTEPLKADSINTLEAPIVVTGEPVGTLQVEADPNRTWNQGDKELVEAVARQVAQQVENLRLLADAQRARADAEAATRRLTREGWQTFEQTAQLPEGYVYDRNEVAPLDGTAEESNLAKVSRPLTVRGEMVGEIAVEPEHPLGAAEQELLETVAGRLSAHIENLRLLEETERSRQQADKRAVELQTVAELSTVASTILEAERLLQEVVDLTKTRFDLYHAHIYLMDETDDFLHLSVGAGEVGRQLVEQRHTIPVGQERSLVARAARTREAVVVNDVRAVPDFLPNPLLPETRSEMALPLLLGERVLGVFDVQARETNRFTQEDVRIQSTLAAQVAVALQNAYLYAEQAAAVTRLREIDQLKSSFLANMSHELRTPLNSILGFTDVMLEGLDGDINDRMETDLRVIQKNGQHLLNLINDVLDMAKIEAGRMTLSPELFNLEEIFDEVLSITGPLANAKSVDLYVEPDSARDVDLNADRFRLRQVMLNLVNNAIKFTENGKVSLRAVRENGNVVVRVKDTGLGIPADHLDAIFQEFTQVDASTTRKSGGTGLGLPISRRLVELHGGRLWAESTGVAGEGSAFYIELPVEARMPAAQAQQVE